MPIPTAIHQFLTFFWSNESAAARITALDDMEDRHKRALLYLAIDNLIAKYTDDLNAHALTVIKFRQLATPNGYEFAYTLLHNILHAHPTEQKRFIQLALEAFSHAELPAFQNLLRALVRELQAEPLTTEGTLPPLLHTIMTRTLAFEPATENEIQARWQQLIPIWGENLHQWKMHQQAQLIVYVLDQNLNSSYAKQAAFLFNALAPETNPNARTDLLSTLLPIWANHVGTPFPDEASHFLWDFLRTCCDGFTADGQQVLALLGNRTETTALLFQCLEGSGTASPSGAHHLSRHMMWSPHFHAQRIPVLQYMVDHHQQETVYALFRNGEDTELALFQFLTTQQGLTFACWLLDQIRDAHLNDFSYKSLAQQAWNSPAEIAHHHPALQQLMRACVLHAGNPITLTPEGDYQLDHHLFSLVCESYNDLQQIQFTSTNILHLRWQYMITIWGDNPTHLNLREQAILLLYAMQPTLEADISSESAIFYATEAARLWKLLAQQIDPTTLLVAFLALWTERVSSSHYAFARHALYHFVTACTATHDRNEDAIVTQWITWLGDHPISMMQLLVGLADKTTPADACTTAAHIRARILLWHPNLHENRLAILNAFNLDSVILHDLLCQSAHDRHTLLPHTLEKNQELAETYHMNGLARPDTALYDWLLTQPSLWYTLVQDTFSLPKRKVCYQHLLAATVRLHQSANHNRDTTDNAHHLLTQLLRFFRDPESYEAVLFLLHETLKSLWDTLPEDTQQWAMNYLLTDAAQYPTSTPDADSPWIAGQLVSEIRATDPETMNKRKVAAIASALSAWERTARHPVHFAHYLIAANGIRRNGQAVFAQDIWVNLMHGKHDLLIRIFEALSHYIPPEDLQQTGDNPVHDLLWVLPSEDIEAILQAALTQYHPEVEAFAQTARPPLLTYLLSTPIPEDSTIELTHKLCMVFPLLVSQWPHYALQLVTREYANNIETLYKRYVNAILETTTPEEDVTLRRKLMAVEFDDFQKSYLHQSITPDVRFLRIVILIEACFTQLNHVDLFHQTRLLFFVAHAVVSIPDSHHNQALFSEAKRLHTQLQMLQDWITQKCQTESELAHTATSDKDPFLPLCQERIQVCCNHLAHWMAEVHRERTPIILAELDITEDVDMCLQALTTNINTFLHDPRDIEQLTHRIAVTIQWARNRPEGKSTSLFSLLFNASYRLPYDVFLQHNIAAIATQLQDHTPSTADHTLDPSRALLFYCFNSAHDAKMQLIPFWNQLTVIDPTHFENLLNTLLSTSVCTDEKTVLSLFNIAQYGGMPDFPKACVRPLQRALVESLHQHFPEQTLIASYHEWESRWENTPAEQRKALKGGVRHHILSQFQAPLFAPQGLPHTHSRDPLPESHARAITLLASTLFTASWIQTIPQGNLLKPIYHHLFALAILYADPSQPFGTSEYLLKLLWATTIRKQPAQTQENTIQHEDRVLIACLTVLHTTNSALFSKAITWINNRCEGITGFDWFKHHTRPAIAKALHERYPDSSLRKQSILSDSTESHETDDEHTSLLPQGNSIHA